MKNTLSAGFLMLTIGLLSGCSGMSERDRNTAIGAGVGGVAGAAVIGGPAATIGGAAVGGVIGNQIRK